MPDLLSNSSITQDMALSYNSAFHWADRTMSSGLTYMHDATVRVRETEKDRGRERENIFCVSSNSWSCGFTRTLYPTVDPHLAVTPSIVKVTGHASRFFRHSSPSPADN